MELKDKTALVIGASGFIGSHLVESLVLNGIGHVIATDYIENKFIRDNYPEVTIVPWDIRKPFGENRLIGHVNKIDWIFHLGAITDAAYCEKNPDEAYEVNTYSARNIFNFGEEYHFSNFVYLSTLGVYGNPDYLPIDEDHPKKPHNVYTQTKLECERLVMDYKKGKDRHVSVARSFNAYGPRQKPSMVIPKIIIQALKSDEIVLANTDTSRDFIYVSDVVEGLVKVAESGSSGIYNLGSGNEVYIGELIDCVSAILNKKIKVICNSNEKQSVSRSRADISKSASEINWRPKVALRDGLLKTIKYYEKELGA